MIYRSLAEVPSDFGPCAITIGNFDGVHRGHRQIMQRVRELAREHGWKAAVLTFDPHPSKLVAPDRAPRLLTPPEERARLILGQGIDEVLILPFTSEVAKLTPEEFVREILAGKLKARAVLVGDNFRFGNRAAGHAGSMEELGRKYGFTTEIVKAISWRGRVISSSEIRGLIQAGNVSLVCRLLGWPYALQGKVVPGEGRGSKQTVPTLNLDTKAEVLPKVGVYITRTRESGGARFWPSITNVGYRPTFNGHGITIETYLLSSLDGEPPEEISVEFLRWVREERKFENAEALKAQILRDVSRAQAYFRRLEEATAPSGRMSENQERKVKT
jgi:riboflavin kinase/FMN adenylyltransferase